MRLYEVIQLNEYNSKVTAGKWGQKLIDAATINQTTTGGDGWFANSTPVGGLQIPNSKSTPEDKALWVRKLLFQMEMSDPTKNNQYVMWMVKVYTNSTKANAEQVQGAVDPAALGSFRIEDLEQVDDVLRQYHTMKPQLQVEDRDINRFKTFFRLEDFVDKQTDVANNVPTDKEVFNRNDVDTIYSGPLGTVAIPRSHEASCELGSGTKWCTTGKDSYWHDSYSERGDLIIYNEKPGNAKYQLHVTMDGIEARDARDRLISPDKKQEFVYKHPVISKLIKQKKQEIFVKVAQQPYSSEGGGAMALDQKDPFQIAKQLIDFNEEHQGGAMRYVDEYFEKFAMPTWTKNSIAPARQFTDLLLIYAAQRNAPWTNIEPIAIELLKSILTKFEPSNTQINTINRVITTFDKLNPNWPALEQIKTVVLQKISQANVTKSQLDKAAADLNMRNANTANQ